MAPSCGKCVLIISLVLISAAELHAGRANVHSTEYINNSSNITVKYAENIRDNIRKRMMLTTDELFAVSQQLHPHHVFVNTSREREQLQEVSKIKRALQNCESQVSRMQRRENAKLLCGQLFIMLQTV